MKQSYMSNQMIQLFLYVHTFFDGGFYIPRSEANKPLYENIYLTGTTLEKFKQCDATGEIATIYGNGPSVLMTYQIT